LIKRVLIANRGAIACRIIRTVRATGRRACAIYSEADHDSPHVGLADDARCIGPPAPAESYLAIDRVIQAAKDMNCDAVHPGYGFLSENAGFAEQCAAAGLVFVGPTPDAIRLMGDKARAREVAERAGVPPAPGFQGDQDDAALSAGAQQVGYPLLVKATMGGGGKGMRRVASPDELPAAITGARREAESAFGNGALMLERFVHPARHVEVQVLADTHGNIVPLLERECSLQRRHQKVIEECPSVAVTPELRQRLGAAAVQLARSVDYVGAGTVEFLLEDSGQFWFLEMNTRLQVEHGVTELVTGEDLVAWQLAIAQGAEIGSAFPQPPSPNGWALQARIYAEKPEAGFLPQAGPLRRVVLPQGPGIRIDSGVVEGQEVTPHYDPMLMKVMAHGRDREQARSRLFQALSNLHILGLPTNTGFLLDILDTDYFRNGETFTHTLEAADPPREPESLPPQVLPLAAWGLSSDTPGASRSGPTEGAGPVWSPQHEVGPFRIVPGAPTP